MSERLAFEAGLSNAGEPMERPPVVDPTPAHPGGVLSELAALHGFHRAREWDAVTHATTAGIRPGSLRFVALPTRELVVVDGVSAEDVPDDALRVLAEAVETTLSPPYRAEAVRRGDESWTIGARRTQVVELRADLEGDEIELAVQRGDRELTVDGIRRLASLRELEALAEPHESYVVRALRVDERFWEVDVLPL